MRRAFVAVLAAVSCAALAQAQTVTSSRSVNQVIFTLEQARTRAGGSSPSIDSATAGVRAANAARVVSGLLPNPQLQVQSENVAGSGVYQRFRSAESTASLSMPIELGGKRSARMAVADSRSVRAQIDAAIAVAELNLRVTQAYTQAASADRRVEIARQQAEIANNAFQAARTRVKAGASPPIDQQRADVFRINAKTALDRALRDAQVAHGNLERLIGQPIAGALDLAWFDRIDDYGPSIAVSSEGTLALAAANADVDTAGAEVRLARSQQIPDVTISAGVRRLSATNDTAAVIGFSIPLPIFNSGTAAVSQARAQAVQAEANRRQLVLDAEQAIAAARAELLNAATTARSAGGPALAAANEAARVARLGYAQGKFSQLDLLEAERTLADTRTALTDAVAAYHDAAARLERLTAAAPILGDR